MAQPAAPAAADGPPVHQRVGHAFLTGSLPAPDPRVYREGAPDNLPEYRQAPLRSLKSVVRHLIPTLYANQFKYSPITKDQIRLLCIRKGNPEDPMSCIIFPRKLSEAKGCYEALSYCWGTEIADCKISLLDAAAQLSPSEKFAVSDAVTLIAPRRFYVRPNLYAAMLNMRKVNKDIIMWIDAICINQGPGGEKEKEEQLSQMAEIYNSASNVCIWLGDADPRSPSAMQLARRIMNFQKFDAMISNHSTKSEWRDLIGIMRSPWFSRRWIIQEVALARNASVHCGTHVIHWDDFSDAVTLLNEKLEGLRVGLVDVETFAYVESLSASILVKNLSNLCRKSDDSSDLEKLLDLETLVSTLLSFEARDAQDTIYSLLSIARDAPKDLENHPYGVTPNYKRSTRDLYVAFVKRSILSSKCLDIICRHWAPPVKDLLEKKVDLPSWISLLSKSPFGLPGPGRDRQNGENFVGYSCGDIRKRYKASRELEPVLDHASFHDTISGKAIVESPPPSPAAEKLKPFQNGMDTILEEPQRGSPSNVITRSVPLNVPNTKIRVRHPSKLPSQMQDKEHGKVLSGILKVSGFKLGVIEERSDVVMRGIIPGKWLEKLGWNKTANQNRVPDRLWRTIVADRNAEGGRTPGWYQRACLHCLRDAKITDTNGSLAANSTIARASSEMTREFVRRVESVVWNRRLFSAAPDKRLDRPDDFLFFGLGPEETQDGDELCILFGCTVPVLLRKVRDTPPDHDLYELVGESYVHGMMDGEAVDNEDLVKDMRQWFELQ